MMNKKTFWFYATLIPTHTRAHVHWMWIQYGNLRSFRRTSGPRQCAEGNCFDWRLAETARRQHGTLPTMAHCQAVARHRLILWGGGEGEFGGWCQTEEHRGISTSDNPDAAVGIRGLSDTSLVRCCHALLLVIPITNTRWAIASRNASLAADHIEEQSTWRVLIPYPIPSCFSMSLLIIAPGNSMLAALLVVF